MTRQQIKLIRSTAATVARLEPQTLGALFFNRLFQIAPEMEGLFLSPAPAQALQFTDLLADFTDNLELLPSDNLPKLLQQHAGYSLTEQHCLIIGNALLWTLEKGLQQGWTDAVEEAWAGFVQKLFHAVTATHYKAAA